MIKIICEDWNSNCRKSFNCALRETGKIEYYWSFKEFCRSYMNVYLDDTEATCPCNKPLNKKGFAVLSDTSNFKYKMRKAIKEEEEENG